jgi:hypothetical protein
LLTWLSQGIGRVTIPPEAEMEKKLRKDIPGPKHQSQNDILARALTKQSRKCHTVTIV